MSADGVAVEISAGVNQTLNRIGVLLGRRKGLVIELTGNARQALDVVQILDRNAQARQRPGRLGRPFKLAGVDIPWLRREPTGPGGHNKRFNPFSAATR